MGWRGTEQRHAAERLRDPDALVKQVARELGFADAFAFSRTFKRVFGLAPDEARVLVFVEKLSPEDLAVLLMRLPGYSFEVRAVDPDYHSLEVEATQGRAPDGFGGH